MMYMMFMQRFFEEKRMVLLMIMINKWQKMKLISVIQTGENFKLSITFPNLSKLPSPQSFWQF